MRFIDLVRARESCREYTDRPVKKEDLCTILEAGRLSPSACNIQPWRFFVVHEGDLVGKTAKCMQGMGMNRFTDQVPAFIIICEQTTNLKQTVASGIGGHSFAQMDIGIAAAHMMLCARTMGIDSCIIGWFSDKKLRELLNLPNGCKVRLVLALGYGKKAEPRTKRRMEFDDIVTFVETPKKKGE
ncbi:MAG: nitroreductase family protein [Clostridia bacterium]|nr:nitroreductase family protein [Clostridia bacterium]